MDIRITPHSNQNGNRFRSVQKNTSITINNALPEPPRKQTKSSATLTPGVKPLSKVRHQSNLLVITSADTQRKRTHRFSSDYTTVHQQRGIALYKQIESHKLMPEGTELVNRVNLRA